MTSKNGRNGLCMAKGAWLSILLALASAYATLCPLQSLAHPRHPYPPPPPEHHVRDCSLLSGTIGFIGGVLSSVGIVAKPKPEVVVVNQSMGYVPIPQEAKPVASPATMITTIEEEDGGGWFSRRKKGKRIVVKTEVVHNDVNTGLVWVEGYYVERNRGNYVETSFVPGHWEKRERR